MQNVNYSQATQTSAHYLIDKKI